MPQLKQNADGSMGIEGAIAGPGEFVTAAEYWTATSVDSTFMTTTRPMVVQGIVSRIDVAGTDAGAVTAIIRKVPSGTALTSGTALHSGSINLKGTAATNQTLTLSTTASDLRLAAGDSLVIDFTGVLTSAVGCVTVMLNPA